MKYEELLLKNIDRQKGGTPLAESHQNYEIWMMLKELLKRDDERKSKKD